MAKHIRSSFPRVGRQRTRFWASTDPADHKQRALLDGIVTGLARYRRLRPLQDLSALRTGKEKLEPEPPESQRRFAAVSTEEIADFIRASFRSAWALELILLLKNERDSALTHDQMVQGLRGSELIVRQSLEGLAAAGLIVPDADGSARYCPATPEADEMVEQAATLYARSPNAVRRMIVEAANPGITAFADAFKLRKD